MTDRVTIGNVELMAFIDMVPPPRNPLDFFPGVPEQAWEPYKQDVLVNGQVQLYYGCFALRSQGKLVMVDTGIGPGPHPTRGNLRGDLLNQMRKQGVNPEDVDIVVHTHLHFDHVGWNLTKGSGWPRATFPKARYLVPRLDWEYFTKPEVLEKQPHMRTCVMPLPSLGLMDLIEGVHTVTSEVTTFPTPGHTPGSINIIINSQGEKGAIVGDMIHNKIEVLEPSWSPGADVDKAASVRSRLSMLYRFEQESFVVAAGHFHPDERFGRLVRLQGRRYWQGI